jgi:hypothetical protein
MGDLLGVLLYEHDLCGIYISPIGKEDWQYSTSKSL